MASARVTQLISLAARALNRAGDAMLAESGLRMAHVPVVVSLRGSATGLTQKALADAVGVEQPSMAQLLVRMERDGLVRRDPHPTDARSRLVVIADDQDDRIKRAQQQLALLESTAVIGLSENEITTLTRLLDRVLRNLQHTGNGG